MANTALDLVRSRAGTSTDDAVRGKDSKRRRPMLLVVASAAAAALIAQHPSPLWHGKPPAERQRFAAAAQAAAPAADEPSDFMKFLEETRPREPPPSKEPPSKERADLGADLVDWLRAGGAECDAVEVASLAGYGRGLVAKRAIEAGDLVPCSQP